MNLTLAKMKKRRHFEGPNPFAKGAPPPPALLQTAQEGLPHAMRLEGLRNGNFHTVRDYERQLSLAEGKKRYQTLQTMEHEYDRLRSQHGLLQGRAAERMQDLKQLLGIKDA